MPPHSDARCILVYLHGHTPLRRRATAAYSWTLPGNYTLTVTATNPCGETAESFPVEVSGGRRIDQLYLPLVLRDSG